MTGGLGRQRRCSQAAHAPPPCSLFRHDLVAPLRESLPLIQATARQRQQEMQRRGEGRGAARSGTLRLRAAGGGDARLYEGVRILSLSVLRSGVHAVSDRGLSSLSRDAPYFLVRWQRWRGGTNVVCCLAQE